MIWFYYFILIKIISHIVKTNQLISRISVRFLNLCSAHFINIKTIISKKSLPWKSQINLIYETKIRHVYHKNRILQNHISDLKFNILTTYGVLYCTVPKRIFVYILGNYKCRTLCTFKFLTNKSTYLQN